MSEAVEIPVIEYGIPLPAKRSNVKWPLRKMGPPIKGKNGEPDYASFPLEEGRRKVLSSIVARYHATTDMRFEIRKEKPGWCRCYRVK